jgi:UDP-N-acetylglucosamine/UDP-N-acetylgalactosamine diphosphorylase
MNMKPLSLTDRLDQLSQNGVEVVDPRQTFVDETVRLDRVFPGSVLFPGTRLSGSNTAVAPGARIGTEGPATVANSVIGENAEVASGYVTGSVLLTNARIGSNAHVRSGTLLEEEASTAHAVGLKQTVLMSFVTLGSLINCCDCLISGGRSRSNHTEVGSGFIHFNFTPWGDSGDKATPSLIGGVPQGVFLRQERIFIGGMSGMIGPHRVGFGSVTVAGQVIRSDVAANRIHSETPRRIDAPWDFRARRPSDRLERNLEYIGHLVALRSWYVSVRKRRIPQGELSSHQSTAIDAAVELLDGSIVERWARLAQFLGYDLPSPQLPAIPCPLLVEPSSASYVNWIKNLPEDDVKLGVEWLQQLVEVFIVTNAIQTPAMRKTGQ